MQTARVLILSLLCLLFPLEVLALAPAGNAPAHGSAHHGMPAMKMDAKHHCAMPDCCKQGDTTAPAGKCCGAAPHCSTASPVGILVSREPVTAAPLMQPVWPPRSPHPLAASPAGIWRPPATV